MCVGVCVYACARALVRAAAGLHTCSTLRGYTLSSPWGFLLGVLCPGCQNWTSRCRFCPLDAPTRLDLRLLICKTWGCPVSTKGALQLCKAHTVVGGASPGGWPEPPGGNTSPSQAQEGLCQRQATLSTGCTQGGGAGAGAPGVQVWVPCDSPGGLRVIHMWGPTGKERQEEGGRLSELSQCRGPGHLLGQEVNAEAA